MSARQVAVYDLDARATDSRPRFPFTAGHHNGVQRVLWASESPQSDPLAFTKVQRSCRSMHSLAELRAHTLQVREDLHIAVRL